MIEKVVFETGRQNAAPFGKGVVKRDILWCFWGALKWGGKTPPHLGCFLAEFLCTNYR